MDHRTRQRSITQVSIVIIGTVGNASASSALQKASAARIDGPSRLAAKLTSIPFGPAYRNSGNAGAFCQLTPPPLPLVARGVGARGRSANTSNLRHRPD